MNEYERFELIYYEDVNELFQKFRRYNDHYSLKLFQKNNDCYDLFEFLQDKTTLCDGYSGDESDSDNIYGEV